MERVYEGVIEMSTTLGGHCECCKNSIPRSEELPEGGCKAFPNGIPYEYLFKKDVTKLDECANGYKYEYDEERDILKKFGIG